MKKQFLLLSFAVVLFLGSQATFAQSDPASQNQAYSSELTPKIRTIKVIETFSRRINVTVEQKQAIQTLFNDNQAKFAAVAGIEDKAERIDKEVTMNSYIDEQLKAILTKTQFEMYLRSKM